MVSFALLEYPQKRACVYRQKSYPDMYVELGGHFEQPFLRRRVLNRHQTLSDFFGAEYLPQTLLRSSLIHRMIDRGPTAKHVHDWLNSAAEFPKSNPRLINNSY